MSHQVELAEIAAEEAECAYNAAKGRAYDAGKNAETTADTTAALAAAVDSTYSALLNALDELADAHTADYSHKR
jgi:hypothetical protein